jgi:hypothetical protein
LMQNLILLITALEIWSSLEDLSTVLEVKFRESH